MRLMILDKTGWPVTKITNRWIVNILRKIIHGRKIVCHDCWYAKQAQKNTAIEIFSGTSYSSTIKTSDGIGSLKGVIK